MQITIAEISGFALCLNAVAAGVLLCRSIYLGFFTYFPRVSILILMDAVTSVLFVIVGADSKIASEFFRDSTLAYAILFVLAASEVFKELYCQLPGLKRVVRNSIIGWQLFGFTIGASALALLERRWGTKGFDCLTFLSTEALRCTSFGLTGFVAGSYWRLSKLPIQIPDTTRFLTVWLVLETLPNGLVLWIGMAFFPYSGLYIDICNIIVSAISTGVAIGSLRLSRPRFEVQQHGDKSAEALSSFEHFLEKLISTRFQR